MRFNIPREGLKLEGDHPPLPGFPGSFPPMVGSMINIRQSVLDLDRNPTDGKRQRDPETLDELTKFAKSVGADEISYASVPQEWLFQDTAIRYTQAIVLVMETDKERMSLAPNRDTAVMVHETYNALGQISNKIADWLRERGYAAHAEHVTETAGELVFFIHSDNLLYRLGYHLIFFDRTSSLFRHPLLVIDTSADLSQAHHDDQ